jgi:deoxyguanosine kinase
LAIEGIIGVGKTSLVHRLHADMGGLRVLEENPFLVGGFYQDMERYAFNTEMFFLLARFRQQREVARVVRDTHEPIHSDYVFQKNRIFAELTLWARISRSGADCSTRCLARS